MVWGPNKATVYLFVCVHLFGRSYEMIYLDLAGLARFRLTKNLVVDQDDEQSIQFSTALYF